jgi:hypothetical protein
MCEKPQFLVLLVLPAGGDPEVSAERLEDNQGTSQELQDRLLDFGQTDAQGLTLGLEPDGVRHLRHYQS